MENNNILITGGAGYIGSHTSWILKEKGYNPICFDNFSNNIEDNFNFCALYKGDILNINSLRTCIQTYQPIAVCHLAAFVSVEESIKNPAAYYKNNIAGSLNLLHVMNEYGIRYLVFASSSCIYKSQHSILSEDSQIKPISPYAKSKAILEAVLNNVCLNSQVEAAILRYTNVGGALYQCNLGEKKNSVHIIPKLVSSSLTGIPVELHTSNIQTKDGTCVRDYVHVLDVAYANFLALEYLFKSGNTDYFNISSGKGYSVLDLIHISNKIFENKVTYDLFPPREGDIPIIMCNNKKAEEILQWKPTLTIHKLIEDNYCLEKSRLRNETMHMGSVELKLLL